MSAREEIAAAASAADEVDCSPYYLLLSKPGQAYVEWLRDESPGFGAEEYWGVIVCLPNDTKAAQQWVEEHKESLREACGEALVVTQMRPDFILSTDNQSQKVLVLEGHRGAGE